METPEIIGYIVLGIIVFFIAVYIIRAIFSIPKLMKLQTAQLQILTEIAIQQGVKSDVLMSIHVANELKAREKTFNEQLKKPNKTL